MASKGNKAVLESVNYNLNVIKDIKEGKEFTREDKEKIFNNYTGMSSDNNSFFTPVEICSFIKDLLNIKSGKVADLSAGIGNMVRPFVTEYGKLLEGIEFDCYELDENNSLAGAKAWEDYGQVKYNMCFNSLERADEIPNDYYDFIIGNPPFVGSVEYLNDFNNNKGKPKKTDIVSCFIDLSIKKVKDKGCIALVLPGGHLYNSAAGKLREWMKTKVALKGIFPLDSSTFEASGIMGTSVGTYLIIWQKGTPQKEIFIGELADKKELKLEMKSIAKEFQLFASGGYEIIHCSDNQNGLHGKLVNKNWENK